ncbi:MAG TPA: hypothetical protein VE736_12525 [Gaiellaceae bacterium]|nr:hypothetical protein [Gaiellaceae bacterium]
MVGRVAALLGVLAALALYDAFHAQLWNASTWWDVAFIAAVLMPVSFAVVWLLLPVRDAPAMLPAGVALAVLTAVFHLVRWETPENLTKLCAVTLIGFWFLGYFETVSWVVLVALIIPWVDAFSVFSHRGPTHKIVANHPYVLNALSYAFPIPGEHAAANLGVPDLLFFALFLAAAARYRLRIAWTWIALVTSFGVTIALAVKLGLAGLPALPGVALGFLLPNADRLWAARAAPARGPS